MEFQLAEHTHRRQNPLTGAWVLVSPHRTKRPWQGQVENVAIEQNPPYDPDCYLCPGNARANGDRNPKYTSTHSFTNDFSALVETQPAGGMVDGLLRADGVRGVCRVVMFSPRHDLTLARMTAADILSVVHHWSKDYADLVVNPLVNYVQVFENKGAMMGCSNPHPHGQIWASESIPQEIGVKDGRQREYFDRHGRPLLADYLRQELERGERLVYSNAEFVVLVPFWAVWPYETMILPRRPVADLLHFDPNQLSGLADALQVLTARYDNLFQTSFPYSAGMHQAPCRSADSAHFTWHMLFYPPLLRSATIRKFMVGYEMLAEPQRDFTPEQGASAMRVLSDLHYSFSSEGGLL